MPIFQALWRACLNICLCLFFWSNTISLGASKINSKQLGIRQSSIFSIGRWAFSWPLSNTWNFEEEKYYQLIVWLYVFSIYYLSSNWLTFEVIKSSMSVGGVSYNILFHTWPCLVQYSTHLFGRVNEGLALPQRCSGLVPTLTYSQNQRLFGRPIIYTLPSMNKKCLLLLSIYSVILMQLWFEVDFGKNADISG